MADIVDFISDLSYEDIPEMVLHTTRLCVLDAVGCMAGGIQNKEVVELAGKIAEKNPGSTNIVGTSLTSTRPWASFVNSHACTYFDLDDGHRKAQGHPGGVIIPLSLMLAAENKCSGKELLVAVVVGYETAVRSAQIIREAGGPRKGSGGWNLLGGIAAAARLCSLSKLQTRNALGLGEYYAPQAPQDRSLAYPSSMKEGMSWSAHSVMSIVELAEVGFDGMVPFLCGAKQCEDLGTNWEIASSYFKMYACCRFSHPVLDGLTTLIEENDIQVDKIQSITVTSFAKALLLNHLKPENPVAAMYSIPYIIGCFLTQKRVGPREMSFDLLDNPEILKIARKVRLVEDSKITDKFPLHCLARVTISTNNGNTIKSETLSAKGDPANPFNLTEMYGKFKDMVEPLFGSKEEVIYHQIMNIQNEDPGNLWDSLG